MTHAKIVPATRSWIRNAAALLKQGELVGVPTETVYGLAANAFDAQAVQRIFLAKGRPASNPLIVHLASDNDLNQVIAHDTDAIVRERVQQLSVFWPGPLTLVLPRGAAVPNIVTAGRDTVAVRVPAHPVMRELIDACGFPLAAPSANRSEYVSPTTAEHVAEGLAEQVSLILDGGPCAWGLESTVLLVTPDANVILRHGGVTQQELQQCLGMNVREVELAATMQPLAPGMSRVHYSPRTRVAFADGPEAVGATGRIGYVAFSPPPEAVRGRYERVEVLSESGNLGEAARNLFACLRQLDKLGLDWILVEQCPETGIGKAIMDRLRRAASRVQ